MSTNRARYAPGAQPGPFTVKDVREGSRYELSNGHPVYCMPSGRRGGRSNLVGGSALETDPAVVSAGVDVGFTAGEGQLRAPDVAVGDFANEPGYAKGVPPLAVEYADTRQDEKELQAKIREFLAAGTRFIWVVRLTGPRRVEIHEKNKRVRLAHPGEELKAPGILKNSVPVEALFDREAAHAVTLRNLLQRKGYESLEHVQAEGEARGEARGEATGRIEALLILLRARGFALSGAAEKRIRATSDVAVLDRWIARAATAASVDEVVAKGKPRAQAKGRARAKK